MVVTGTLNTLEPTLIVYPNPAQHSLNCIFPWEGNATLSNLQGQTCWEGPVGRSETLDIQSLPNGVYFLGFEGLNVKILIHR